MRKYLFTLLPLLLVSLSPALAQRENSTFEIGAGQILTWYGGNRIALVGDPEGTGHAHFLGLSSQDHLLDFARMAKTGKLLASAHARENFGGNALAAVCGRFTGRAGTEALAVFEDGSLLVAYDMHPEKHTYAQITTILKLTHDQIPKAPAQALSADLDGDGKPDVLLAGADGKLLLLHNAGKKEGTPQFEVQPVKSSIHGRRIVAGSLKGTRKASLLWIEKSGRVQEATLDGFSTDTISLSKPTLLTTASPDDGLAIGHFRGDPQADIVVGQRLFPAGVASNPLSLPNLPDAKKAKGDYAWLAGDFNGDGKDDLLRLQRNGDPLDGDHVYIYYSHDSQDSPTLQFGDADNDGLPDAWENGAIHPGGLDLKALGCSPNHADVVVEIQRMADVPEEQLRKDMEKAIHYFASLPVKNPDGKPGIALHLIYLPAIPLSEKNLPWWELGTKYHVATHRGITHWMMIYNGGGGQSSEMGDDGGCGRFGMPAVFIHEFGHQLGLGHTGRWNAGWCPTYSSLMNYAYSYQLNGKAENISYSDGRLSSVVLNERDLNEYLPLPIEKLSFISGPPYRYRLKPAPDGKGTLIDWNWNGVFGERHIKADINYGYSTNGGERNIVGKTYASPCVATYGAGKSERLLLFTGGLLPGTPAPAVEVKAKEATLSAQFPGMLNLQVWQGKNASKEGTKWSPPVVVEAKGVVGEAAAVAFQKRTWVAYPTLVGVVLRQITLDSVGVPQIGEAQPIPDSQGAQPTLVPLPGRMGLFLWRDSKTPLGFRWLALQNSKLNPTPETKLAFTSTFPVGASFGKDTNANPALWIGLTQDQDEKRPSRWQVRCLTIEGQESLHQTEQFWADGDKGGNRGEGRVTLLWEADRAFGSAGRWYFLQRGGPKEDLNQMDIGMKIADKSVNGGCLTRRYYDEWTNSRGAPGVCWFRGDMVLAIRWFGDAPAYKDNDNLIAFFGRGIETEPMGDFDDMREIRDYGLTRSIPNLSE